MTPVFTPVFQYLILFWLNHCLDIHTQHIGQKRSGLRCRSYMDILYKYKVTEVVFWKNEKESLKDRFKSCLPIPQALNLKHAEALIVCCNPHDFHNCSL